MTIQYFEDAPAKFNIFEAIKIKSYFNCSSLTIALMMMKMMMMTMVMMWLWPMHAYVAQTVSVNLIITSICRTAKRFSSILHAKVMLIRRQDASGSLLENYIMLNILKGARRQKNSLIHLNLSLSAQGHNKDCQVQCSHSAKAKRGSKLMLNLNLSSKTSCYSDC